MTRKQWNSGQRANAGKPPVMTLMAILSVAGLASGRLVVL